MTVIRELQAFDIEIKRIKREIFGRTLSNDIGRLKGFVDTAIEDFSTLSNEDYLLLIESFRRATRNIIQSFDSEIKRLQ